MASSALWTQLAVDLAQRFDGITVANGPLQAGCVIDGGDRWEIG